MGGKQSALKKEIAALHQEARKRSGKHQEELAAAAKEKRLLQVKIDELQAAMTQAQEEVEKLKNEAREREERMKALKWELVRQLRLTGSPTSASPRASLSPSPSTRISLNWRLNDDVALRQSTASPTKASNDTPAASNNTPNLFARRRSLVKNSETTATSPSPNQAGDFDAKEFKTPSDPPLDAKNVSKSPREAKSDDSPPTSHRSNMNDDTLPSKHHPHNAESKANDDDNPETNDLLRFSEDESS